MAQQQALVVPDQDGGVVQQRGASTPGEVLADEEVTVAVHEEQRMSLAGGMQQGARLRFEAARLVQCIVAHPDLEQIAQDEQRVGRRGAQVVLPSGHGGGFAGLQVQV